MIFLGCKSGGGSIYNGFDLTEGNRIYGPNMAKRPGRSIQVQYGIFGLGPLSHSLLIWNNYLTQKLKL